jgi:hypothetical protein
MCAVLDVFCQLDNAVLMDDDMKAVSFYGVSSAASASSSTSASATSAASPSVGDVIVRLL